jgi:tRNA dimethylallyltransferase
LLVVVLGPTASGKTALSLKVAKEFRGEIVNCDSVAVYREFNIGTAKPSVAERALAPHYLIDCVDPTTSYTAGEYSRDARAILRAIQKRGHVPIVAGGTGLYLRALLEGLFAGPQRSEELRERLRERASERGGAYLHRVLSKVDPAAATKIHSNDTPKVIRAIEVCVTTRQKMTDLWKQKPDPLRDFRILRIGLNPDRDALYSRINNRAEKMFAEGLIEETRMLFAKYGESARPLTSLGYKQAMQVLRREMDAAQALTAAQQAHRNYAKRQITWFRREPDVHWLAGFGDDGSIQAAAVTLVQEQSTISDRP